MDDPQASASSSSTTSQQAPSTGLISSPLQNQQQHLQHHHQQQQQQHDVNSSMVAKFDISQMMSSFDQENNGASEFNNVNTPIDPGVNTMTLDTQTLINQQHHEVHQQQHHLQHQNVHDFNKGIQNIGYGNLTSSQITMDQPSSQSMTTAQTQSQDLMVVSTAMSSSQNTVQQCVSSQSSTSMNLLNTSSSSPCVMSQSNLNVPQQIAPSSDMTSQNSDLISQTSQDQIINQQQIPTTNFPLSNDNQSSENSIISQSPSSMLVSQEVQQSQALSSQLSNHVQPEINKLNISHNESNTSTNSIQSNNSSKEDQSLSIKENNKNDVEKYPSEIVPFSVNKKDDLIQDDSEDDDFRPEIYLDKNTTENIDPDELLKTNLSSSSASSGVDSNEVTSEESDEGMEEDWYDDLDLDAETDTSEESSDNSDDEKTTKHRKKNLGQHFLASNNKSDLTKFESEDFVWEGGLWSPSPSQKKSKKKIVSVAKRTSITKKRKTKRKSYSSEDDSDGIKREQYSDESDNSGYDSDYARPKKKRGRGRPRKRRKVFKPDDPNFDWDVNFSFTCEKCKEKVVGFQKSVDHMDKNHPLDTGDEEEEKFQCILCSRPFGRKDHLKRHVAGHIDGRIPFGQEAILLKERKVKAEKEKALASATRHEDWSTFRIFSCYLCNKEAKGFRAAFLHMRLMHPVKDTSTVLEQLSDGEGSSEFAAPVKENIKKEPFENGDVEGASNQPEKPQFRLNQETGQFDPVSETVNLNESISSNNDSLIQDNSIKSESNNIEISPSKKVDKLFCFQCIFCFKSYVRKDHLKMHLWRHVNAIEPTPMHTTRGYTKSWAEITMWSCKQCPHLGESFPGLTAFIQHNRVSHGMSLGFVCPVCGKDKYTKKDHLKTHVQTHNEVKLPCEFCGKLFADGNKMKRHVNEVHEKLKNFMCNTCGKCFARKDKLRAHEMGVHSNTIGDYRPYLCHICGRGFGRQEHVYRHQKICGERQKEKQELMEDGYNPDKEMRRVGLELGVQNFEKDPVTQMYHCKECNHAFKNKRYIAEHYARNHREENLKLPYRCDECGRGYKIMRDLMRHKKKPHVHKGSYMQKAFVCSIDGCGRRFGREFELKRHEKIHQGIKEHKCDQCDAEFHLRNCLKTHMKTVHDMDLPKAPRKKANLSTSDSEDPNKLKKKRKRRTKKELEEERLLNQNGEVDQQNNSERVGGVNGAINLTSTNPLNGNDQWMSQSINQGYFSQHSLQPGFAHWMLDQPPTMVPSTSNYYQGGGVLSGAITPVNFPKETEDSNQSFTPSIPVARNSTTPTPTQVPEKPIQSNITPNIPSIQPTQATPNFDPLKAALNSINVTSDDIAPNFDEEKIERRKRKNQGAPMTEEERIQYEETITDKKLGAMCTVCGKVFRNRDALDFHVMTTKMPGHGVLQIQKMKSNYAFASMQVEAKLSGVTRVDEVKPDANKTKDQSLEETKDTNQQKNTESSITEQYVDPRTGVFKVKQEPILDDHDEKSDQDKENDIIEMPVKVTVKVEPSSDEGIFKVPEAPPAKKFGKRQIFKCMECQKGFKRQAKLIRHVMKRHQDSLKKKAEEQVSRDIHELTKNAKDKETGRWPCSICGKSLANKQKLQRHIMEVHQKLRNHVCRLCHKGFARAEKLRQHEQDAHEEDELKKVKPIPVPGLPIMKKEPLFKNGPQLVLMPLGCLDCNIQFNDKEEIMEHMAGEPHFFKEDQTSDIECPILTCNLKFTSVGRLVQHLRVGKHNQPCPTCGKTFKRLDKLEIHLRCHSTDRPFACDLCDKAYKDPTSLMFHKKTHTGARPYLCNDCGAGFMKPDHLKRHINSTHLKIKNIKCQYCDMYFSDKYKARIHERKHTGETPYLCSVCAKGFKRKEALDQHSIIHKDLPRDFKCLTCSATFKSQQYLNRHVSRHFAEKRWKCPKCPSAFIDKRDLVTHDKHVHQNLRPFVCEHCASAYKTKQGLQIHLKSYPTGECINMKRFSGRGANRIDMTAAQVNEEDEDPNIEKPFECSHCQKRFSKKEKLEAHARVHSNIKPFICTVEGCSRSFTQNQTLRTHLKQFHQIELPPAARGGRKKQPSTTTTTTTPTPITPQPQQIQQQTLQQSQQSVQIPIQETPAPTLINQQLLQVPMMSLPAAMTINPTSTPPIQQQTTTTNLEDIGRTYQRNFLEEKAREAALREAAAVNVVNNSVEKSMQKLRQPVVATSVSSTPVQQIASRFPHELLPRLDMLAAQSRIPSQNIHASAGTNQSINQVQAAARIGQVAVAAAATHQNRNSTVDHSNTLPQFMLQHQQQLFQQQQHQQQQQQRQQILQQQQQQQQLQQLQQPLGLQQHNQSTTAAFPTMNFNQVDQNISTPLDFYQYAANFANINSMYRN